jgi:prepilin-type N-terminal cleavage/methylation domain-containing protein
MSRSRPVGARRPVGVRQGFTLTEVLVAITIIGILAAFLAPAVMRALATARETAIVLEMKQIEMALEQFKSDHGFYPPSFTRGVDWTGTEVGIFRPATDGGNANIRAAARLSRYLTRMAPQHAENTTPSGVTGGGSLAGGQRTRLEHWWIEVGQFLDQESSIVFWLSGLSKNKQFPITDGAVTWVAGSPPVSAHGYYPGDTVDRENRFDFKDSQLTFFDTAGNVVDAGAVNAWIATYSQAYGKSSGDLVFKYRDAATYDVGVDPQDTASDAYRLGPKDGSETPFPTAGDRSTFYNFANADSFQILTAGMDGELGAGGNIFGADAGMISRTFNGSAISFDGWEGLDNLVNFSEGRIDKYLNNN